ncbi:unnamed protein product, partial [Hapterophycus canaliculatus]
MARKRKEAESRLQAAVHAIVKIVPIVTVTAQRHGDRTDVRTCRKWMRRTTRKSGVQTTRNRRLEAKEHAASHRNMHTREHRKRGNKDEYKAQGQPWRCDLSCPTLRRRKS